MSTIMEAAKDLTWIQTLLLVLRTKKNSNPVPSETMLISGSHLISVKWR